MNKVVKEHFQKKYPNSTVEVTDKEVKITNSGDPVNLSNEDWRVMNGRSLTVSQKREIIEKGQTVVGISFDSL